MFWTSAFVGLKEQTGFAIGSIEINRSSVDLLFFDFTLAMIRERSAFENVPTDHLMISTQESSNLIALRISFRSTIGGCLILIASLSAGTSSTMVN